VIRGILVEAVLGSRVGRMVGIAAVLQVVLLVSPAVALAGQGAAAPVPASPDGETEESAPSSEQEAPDPSTEPPAPDPTPSPNAEEPSVAEPPSEEPAPEDEGPLPEISEPGSEDPRESTAPANRRRSRSVNAKVTICHRTNSRTNPYNQISVSESAAINAHADHTGPIFSPDLPPGADWGDIIPPLPPSLPNGRNWPGGEAILANGCETQPDVGPRPVSIIGNVECVAGPTAIDEVRVFNGPRATDSASFTIFVNGMQQGGTVGPLAPGESEVVPVDVSGFEDEPVTITVESGGEVIATRVVTADCLPPPPGVEITASLECMEDDAMGTLSVINNGVAPVTVSATVNGIEVVPDTIVPAGATEESVGDLSQFEDQSIMAEVFVDGVETAMFGPITVDCAPAEPAPSANVGSVVCPGETSTVTLTNDGEPDSQITFSVFINGSFEQDATVFGGESTTLVGHLAEFEDRSVTIEVRADGQIISSETLSVDCFPPPLGGGERRGPDVLASAQSGFGLLPSTGGSVATWLLVAAGLIALGACLFGFCGGLSIRSSDSRTSYLEVVSQPGDCGGGC
jgi:hypothetical protein